MKRHSTDLMSLVFGVIFLGVAGWWLTAQYVTIDVPHLGWITAAVLIVLGVLGLAGSLRGERPAPTPVTAPTSGPTVEMAPVPPAPATFSSTTESGPSYGEAFSPTTESGPTYGETSESGPGVGESAGETGPEDTTGPEDSPRDGIGKDQDNGTNFR